MGIEQSKGHIKRRLGPNPVGTPTEKLKSPVSIPRLQNRVTLTGNGVIMVGNTFQKDSELTPSAKQPKTNKKV
jgi:hypothetical protein